MPAAGYIELHARSAFSFHRGASSPEQLALRAAELGMPALAVCDRNGVYGAPRLFHTGNQVGVRGIVGAEITLEDGPVLPLLVRTQTGYRNLSRLLTRSQLRNAKGECRVSWEDLGEFREGLACLTGDEEGPLRQALAREDFAGAENTLQRLVRLFGREHLRIEIQRHRLRGEARANRSLIELARKHNLRLLATNGTLYARPEARPLLDVFTCLRNYTHLDAAGTLLSRNAERHLKTASQMRALFRDLPEAVDHTVQLAHELEFTLDNLGYRFPDFPVEAGDTMEAKLRRETRAGAKERYGRLTPKVRRQLDRELDLIRRLGFSGYFLIVWDLVRHARENNVLVQGRGSAANSAVCYSLGITAVDPIGSKLLFERFLSEGRRSWPDIDLDLPSGDRRESIIQEVYRRYAPNGAAMTANVITYRGRSAMREVGKALNLPNDVIGRFSELYAGGDFPNDLEFAEHVEKAGLPREHPRLPALANLYRQVHGLPRHLGQHSGGMIVCNHGLDSVVPLENAAMPGRIVAQWDKDDCEDLGIIKIDLLGLGMMSVLQDCVELCQTRGPEREFDLAQIPKDDPATYNLMQKAETIGAFQLESRAQMATLPRMKPKTFYDVAIEVAIIRPGPIAGNLTHPYLDRRNGRRPVTCIHPLLEPVLERTLGVPLFQEQVLKMAMIMAEFTGSEAEELRRAMSFHRSEERMRKVMVKLRAALAEKGVETEVQDRIVDAIQSFALYGFPESHAISFALLAYASCWLKVHRAPEFYAALLNNQPMGFYSPATLIEDARRRGLRIRPVSVTESGWHCTIEDDRTVRLGLNLVKGLSRHSAERILESRTQSPWRNLDDFLLRTRLRKDERRTLAEIGALNSLASHRRDALWNVEKQADPDDLFFHAEIRQNAAAGEEAPPSTLAPMTAPERMQADYRGLELTTGPHPMSFLRDRLEKVWRASDLPRATPGQTVRIAGIVICRQRPATARGNLFISLEDETGISNAFVPARTFEKNRLVITQESLLIIEGKLQLADGVASVLARRFEPLPLPDLQTPISHDFH